MKTIDISENTNAYLEGIDGASEWLDNNPEATRPLPAEFFAWRARCYASARSQFENRPEFPQMMAEWERGFDSIASEAEAPAPSRQEIIKRIVGQANAVAAMLSVVDAMPIIDQHNALCVCAGLADGIAADVSTLARGTL
jgi:hypothetical protein